MRVMVTTAGGKPEKKTMIYRISIPIPWARALNITKEDAGVVMDFDGENIIIHRKREE